MGRPEEYDQTSRTDVRSAFRRAYDEIKEAQEALRKKDPESPLLKLVSLYRDGQGCEFHHDFKHEIFRHIPDLQQFHGWYYALGCYVDLMEAEAAKK